MEKWDEEPCDGKEGQKMSHPEASLFSGWTIKKDCYYSVVKKKKDEVLSLATIY